MLARRSSNSSLPPPSSPPSAWTEHGEANNDSEARDAPSPAQTLWTAHPSPTQTLGFSSPELPPLPNFTGLTSIPRTPSTVARHQQTDSTYYTASWGSPYQNPPPAFNLGQERTVNLGSDDIEEEEESSTLLFGLEHLLPSRLTEDDSTTQFNLEHLLPSRLNFDSLQTPARTSGATEPDLIATAGPSTEDPDNPTSEWVRQFLAGRWDSWRNEAANWWSDGSANSDQENKPVEYHDASSQSSQQKKKGHKSRENNLTLKQQDFWAHFSQGQKETLTKMMASRHAPQNAAAFAESQKSPPLSKPAPVEQSLPAMGSQEKKQGDKQEAPKPVVQTLSSAPIAPSVSPETTLPPRQRRKVPWKGKACWVSVPRDIPRGTPGYPPKPLSSAEVERKMETFEKAGYDTRGFGHWKGVDEHESLAQNRAVWPDEAVVRQERSNQFRVFIPNRSEWEAYMNELTERKLAALGVSLGGEEEESPAMSRQTSTSQHPGLPFSPPPPTSSTGSHRIRQGSIVSGSSFPFGPSPGHASRQSIASPISAFSNPRGSMHMHRHSTFASPASFIQQQSTSPSGAWSPGQYFGTQDPRGGSPALPLSRPDLADLASPSSPFGMRPNQQFPMSPVQKEDLLVQIQQQQLQAQLLQQQQQQLLGIRPSSTLAEVPEDEAEEDEMPAMRHVAAKPGPEIAVPTPRGHRHNISANLEREARDAEYHLEEAIGKQFDEGGDFSTEPEIPEVKPSNAMTDSKWEESQPILHQPQPHNRAHSLTKQQQPLPLGFGSQENDRGQAELSDDARTNVSDLTNPSLENGQQDTMKSSAQHSKTTSQASGSWKDSKFAIAKPGSTAHSKHTSMSSISKLNVEAKEFKFNPSASFSPSTSSGFSFTPTTSKPIGQGAAAWSNKPSMDSVGSALNVTAPVFKPDAPVFRPDAPVFKVDAPVFKPGSMNGIAMPRANFSFSSQGPPFKPDAPVFNPTITPFNPNQSLPASAGSKIFGNISLSANDIIKPAKRSKAIPILPPSALRQKTPEKEDEPEHKEDRDGRIGQADGREKRARRGRDDGDEVPKFATVPILPSQPLGESKHIQAVKQAPQTERKAVPEDKENLSPNVEKASKIKSPEPLSIVGLHKDNSLVEPSMPTGKTDISLTSMEDSKTPIEEHAPRDSETLTPTAEDAPKPFIKKHGSKSSLSATAKPFEFRPQFGSSGFDFGIHVTKPSAARSDDLDSSHMSPPRHANQSPATTFRPSDDGSYKTALESRRHVPYAESESIDFERFAQPSFNEIDAVMKHMNEEGSDFGVERDEEASWGQASPRRSIHDFDRNDLHPNVQLRSDAPSPSPRRVYAPQNLHGSSTSITHDPFSDERAGLAYESPIHRLNNPDDVPISDWDEGITSEGEDKIQTRSRFFDSHVNELIGRVFQNRLGPLERNLRDIHESLALLSEDTHVNEAISRVLQNRLGPLERNLGEIHESIALLSDRSGRGRRSLSTNDRDSDADDEDDEISDSQYRNRSPRKDRKLEKIRSIIKETLETHQLSITSLPVPVPEPVLPEKIREVVLEALSSHQLEVTVEPMKPENVRDVIMEALAHHQPQWTPPKFEPVPAEQIRSIFEEAITAHQPPPAAAPVHEPIEADTIRSIVTEALASHVLPVPEPAPERIWPDDIKSIVIEALAAHQPQAPSIPAAEPVQPEVIRSIVMEALASHQSQTDASAMEPLQPDTIRSIIAEAFESQKPAVTDGEAGQPQVDMSEFYQVVGSLKATVAQAVSGHVQPEEIREMIEDALARQNSVMVQQHENQAIQEKDSRIAGLELLLKDANSRADEEFRAREAIEAREANTARLLKVTEEELLLLREAAKDDENKVRALTEEREDIQRELFASVSGKEELHAKVSTLTSAHDALSLKVVELENAEIDAKKKLSAAAAENEALQFTLTEYRLSSDKWRDEIQQANEEKERMRQAIETSRVQAEEATRVREAMRIKLEKLQQDMIVASGQAAAERAQWQKSDEAHMKKYEVLSARIEAEGRTRERLERELERLETQEREGMKLKVALEQTQKANARLEELVQELRHENTEHQKNAERFEREFKEAREAGRVEVRRTRVLMEADIDAANNQVNIVRADLESEISRLRAELDSVRMDADTTKAKHELDLEAASDAKKQALDEAAASKNRALEEQQKAFERRVELLAHEHERALDIAREDKERAEAYHKDRLSLADSKLEHLHDKVALLEEKLSVAKEAANAAVQAAQAKAPAAAQTSSASGPEKISPQALRESIAVLQEQLQERESRIESLEHKLSEADSDAPAKLKERDTEIGWLRELLGVRIDDLNDLINALAQPEFDRDSVRDAAIRIRTNLQMEQQEKERLMNGGQAFPTLATLSNFASPKAVQLAAAFGNWRKGRENATSSLAGGSNGPSRNSTPSRARPTGAAQSFLSGLMTPPTSNLRRTPDLPSSNTRPQVLRSNSNSSSVSRGSAAGFPGLGKQPTAPSTPPLLRKAAYDQDAEDGHFSESGFYDDESTVDGDVTPIGLNFGQELQR